MKHRISIKYGTWPLPALAAIAVLLLAAACSGSGAKEQAMAPATQAPPATEAAPPTSAPAEKAEIPVVPIEMNDDGFKVAEVIPGGIVQFNIANAGSEPAAPSLIRIKEGHTRQELSDMVDTVNTNPGDFSTFNQLFNVASAIYGVEDLAPGATLSFYADLRTGDFALSDDNHPDRGLAYFMAHELTGKTEPETVMHIDMVDFAYTMPDVAQGKGLWEFANSGDQWHMAMVIPYNPDMTPEQVLSAFEEPEPSIPVLDGILPMSPGERVWVEVNLQPGQYEVICPLPDLAAVADGGEPMPHLLHGMQHMFTVND